MILKRIDDEKVSLKLAAFVQEREDMEKNSPLAQRVLFFLHLWLNGLHHADEKALKKMDLQNEDFIEFNYRGTIATYDFALMTSLVLLSHDLMLRVEIKAANFGLLQLNFHHRELREGSMMEIMPQLSDHAAQLRDKFGFLSAGKKTKAGSLASRQTMTITEAAEILNKFGYKPKAQEAGSILWIAVEGVQEIKGVLPDDQTVTLEVLKPTPAIHRARQLIRRAAGKQRP